MHPITRITTTIEATQPVHWPHFAGSSLRGAFGRALRQASCVTGQHTCTGCPVRNHCAYGVVFDPAPAPQPLHPSFKDGLPRYLVRPHGMGAFRLNTGQQQTFTLILLPGSQSHQAVVQHSLKATTEKHLMQPGLFKLVDTHTETIDPSAAAPRATDTPILQPRAKARITLGLQTPLRIQRKGKPIFKAQLLDANTLVQALQRRHLQWCQLTGQALPPTQASTEAASACALDVRLMQWHDLHRYSNTQQDKLPLGGLVGNATLRGPVHALQAVLPLLQLGEHLNIGKETVMGLGHFRLGNIETG